MQFFLMIILNLTPKMTLQIYTLWIHLLADPDDIDKSTKNYINM